MKYNILYSNDIKIQKEIYDATIVITDDIKLIQDSYNQNHMKKYLVPVMGYLTKRDQDVYILNDKSLSQLDTFNIIPRITFYQSFDFEKKHLINT